MSGPATAAAFSVTTELELSDAIDAANLTPALDVITLGADIALTAYLPSITEDLEVVGNNHTIDAGHAPIEIFYDLGATANIDLTFTGVTIKNADLGFGIDTRFSNVTITDSTFDSAAVQISGTDIAVTVSASTFDNTLLWDGLNVTATGASTVNVSASSADGNTYDGFGLEVGDTSTLSFTGSTATVNQRAGVDIDTNEFATATVTGITADTNGSFGQSGIDIRSDDDSTVTVSRISVNGNDHDGLDVVAHARSSVTVADSNASNNDDDGFDADTYGADASVMFTNSVSTSNDGQGFDFIFNAGTATGTGLTATGNVGGGLALVGESGTVLVSDSTFDGSTDGPGVMIRPDDGTLITLQRITASGNRGGDGGIQINEWFVSGAVSVITIIDSTVDNNEGSGLSLTAVDAGTGNVKDMDAQLGALANNGGLTLTHLPQDGSPVINAGNPAIAGAPATDQRGQTRIVGIIDLGAVEIQAALAATGSDAIGPITGGSLLLGTGFLLLLARRRLLTR